VIDTRDTSHTRDDMQKNDTQIERDFERENKPQQSSTISSMSSSTNNDTKCDICGIGFDSNELLRRHYEEAEFV
ncbi:MAG: hypothetical protein ACRDF4_06745, partial [Rhabdochlamydiaceae bacterium]